MDESRPKLNHNRCGTCAQVFTYEGLPHREFCDRCVAGGYRQFFRISSHDVSQGRVEGPKFFNITLPNGRM